MTEPNTRQHEGVTELYFEEDAEVSIESGKTAIFEYSDGSTDEIEIDDTTKVDVETNVYIPSDTRVFVPEDSDTKIFDPGTGEVTNVYPGDATTTGTGDTNIYDPDDSESTPITDNSRPDPDFSTPTDSKETLKENYDWMFEKALDKGYDPVEAAEAANSMVQTFSDVDSMLE